MAQIPTGLPHIDIERDIRSEVRSRQALHDLHTPRTSPTVDAPDLAMPDYVAHRDGATEIGKLSAEAVLREYEATAKEIESMGVELVERVKQCETMTRDALAVTADLKEIAARYREEARRAFEHIETCSLMVAEARKTCTELKDKLAVPLATDKLRSRRK
jgi:phosphoglycolate phosphatase-like HAD superfamily hydrolase